MPTVPAARCIEEGCDRPALEADARCGLHSARLGPIRDPRPTNVVVPAEQILEAPAPVDRTAARFRTRAKITWVMIATHALLATLHYLFPHVEPDGALLLLFLLGTILFIATPILALALVWASSTWRRRVFAWTSLLIALTPWAVYFAFLFLTPCAIPTLTLRSSSVHRQRRGGPAARGRIQHQRIERPVPRGPSVQARPSSHQPDASAPRALRRGHVHVLPLPPRRA